MRMIAGGLFALALAWLATSVPVVAAVGSCSDLAKVALPHATVTLAAAVPAGAFSPDGSARRRCSRAARGSWAIAAVAPAVARTAREAAVPLRNVRRFTPLAYAATSATAPGRWRTPRR